MKNRARNGLTEFLGDRYHRKNGLLHREDGPAYEDSDGKKEYWLDHHYLTKEEWEKQVEKR